MDPTHPDLSALRAEYELGGLVEDDLAADPLTMFGTWFEQARAAGIVEPNAMVLATSDRHGVPSARTVLLKGLRPEGFVFYTNHDSRKGGELAANPACALVFGWYELQRQVRIEGNAELLDRAETEAYFGGRPRASQLGAWASTQSSEVASRAELDAAYAEAEQRFAGEEIPAPPYWGGYLVIPRSVEFWQGRQGRMHDRLVYRRTEKGWGTHRLAP